MEEERRTPRSSLGHLSDHLQAQRVDGHFTEVGIILENLILLRNCNCYYSKIPDLQADDFMCNLEWQALVLRDDAVHPVWCMYCRGSDFTYPPSVIY